MFILILALFFIGGGWLLGKIVGILLFPKEGVDYSLMKKPTKTTIHNHNIHNHLHVSKEDLRQILLNSKKTF
tara:strand:+ start:54 stop:269 length:216 start_codon:yes stop_codon:yes gene_type:complete